MIIIIAIIIIKCIVILKLIVLFIKMNMAPH